MRHLFAVIISALVASTGPSALADSFGGFSADETLYLSGRDRVCTPLAVSAGAAKGFASCEAADPSRVAAARFRRGTEQRGTRAKYAAAAKSTTLTVSAQGGQGAGAGVVVTWTSTDPIARILGVYVSDKEKLLAVEYESGFGGRLRTEVVAFVLPRAAGAQAEPTPGQEAQPTKPERPAPGTATPGTVTTPTTPALSPDAEKALAQARKLARRGRHKDAAAWYRKVLAADAGHAEARYGMARSLAAQRKLDSALSELQALAASGRDDAAIWLVEARFDPSFARLRDNPAFRAATGLSASPGQKRSLYERLVGFASTWEQPETKCEKPQINLDLDRRARTFALRITSRCGGNDDVTRLRGSFTIKEPDQVILSMPNKGGNDETMQCTMRVCDDEDCLHCLVDMDLDFLVRPVRR